MIFVVCCYSFSHLRISYPNLVRNRYDCRVINLSLINYLRNEGFTNYIIKEDPFHKKHVEEKILMKDFFNFLYFDKKI